MYVATYFHDSSTAWHMCRLAPLVVNFKAFGGAAHKHIETVRAKPS